MHTPGLVNLKSREAKRKEAPQKRKQMLVVIGDSHARGCTTETNQNLGKTFEVTGYVSSGAGLEIITNTARKEIEGLTKKVKESIKIFKLQKKMIRIMMGYKNNHSCRNLFVTLGILPLSSQYIFSLLLFLNKNKNQFKVN
jgi:hypothetical protein